MESYTDESAQTFAQFVAKTYSPVEEHRLKFTVRGWLLPVFKKMLEEKLLEDKQGKKIEQFGFFVNKNPIVNARDKSITAKMFVKMSEVASVVEQLSEFERAPTCTFLNPETMNQDRKNRRVEKTDEQKAEYKKRR